MRARRLFLVIAAMLVALIAGVWVYYNSPAGQPPARAPLRVAAAISLRDALEAIVRDYSARTQQPVELLVGSSGQLFTQIRNGAPIDVFISAAQEPVDVLAREGLLGSERRWIIARNALVLIASKAADGSAKLSGFADLSVTDIKRIAMGDPATVPAGQYAMQVFETLGLGEALRERLIFGTNVRQVLDYVARGEVGAGVVYATDAAVEGERVRVVATADAAWHRPIEYPGVIVKSSGAPVEAQQFLEYLISADAARTLRQFGFAGDAATPAGGSPP